ncbi:MAG: hypothetical protein H6838_05960 [Planctomycetes bacterium]|nr:hypothetical protein [Planctomycetota bacterium]MCB9885016.1 hypothetical protein [Planctomycetota bacterium]
MRPIATSVQLALAAIPLLAPAALAQTRWSVAVPYLPVQGACSAAFDPTANRTFVVGWNNSEAWSVASNTGVWQQLAGTANGPWFRFAPSFAYDALRQRAVCFGGYDYQGTPLADTWELDSTGWHDRTAALPLAPSPRHGAGMCFDAAAGVVRLAGGEGAAVGSPPLPLDEVWTFDGGQWLLVASGTGNPLGATAMTYDGARHRCVALANNGTFVWSGGAFAAVATPTSPPARSASAIAYDAPRDRVVLAGGYAAGQSLGDVWEFDGSTWQQRAPLGPPVPRFHLHGLAFDPVLQCVRLFGGQQRTVSGFGTTTIALSAELRYEPVEPAVAQRFAYGCWQPHALGVSGLPWLGDTVAMTTGTTTAGGLAAFVLGFSNTQAGATPLPLQLWSIGFPSCDLLVSPDSVVVAVATGRVAQSTLTVPNAPGVLGLRLYAQALDLAMPFGTASDGWMLQVGGR